jgi:uncharacterized membrane protein
VLQFCNNYPQIVNVAFAWFNPDNCAELGSWRSEGWWVLPPGSCANVFDHNLDDINRYYCYFAAAVDGAVWAGQYIFPITFPLPFDLCRGIESTEISSAGFRLIDVGDNNDYTLTLVS